MIAGGHDDAVDDDDDKAGVSFCLNSSNRAVQHHKHAHNSNYTPLSSWRVCLCLSVYCSPHFTPITLRPHRCKFYLIYQSVVVLCMFVLGAPIKYIYIVLSI